MAENDEGESRRYDFRKRPYSLENRKPLRKKLRKEKNNIVLVAPPMFREGNEECTDDRTNCELIIKDEPLYELDEFEEHDSFNFFEEVEMETPLLTDCCDEVALDEESDPLECGSAHPAITYTNPASPNSVEQDPLASDGSFTNPVLTNPPEKSHYSQTFFIKNIKKEKVTEKKFKKEIENTESDCEEKLFNIDLANKNIDLPSNVCFNDTTIKLEFDGQLHYDKFAEFDCGSNLLKVHFNDSSIDPLACSSKQDLKNKIYLEHHQQQTKSTNNSITQDPSSKTPLSVISLMKTFSVEAENDTNYSVKILANNNQPNPCSNSQMISNIASEVPQDFQNVLNHNSIIDLYKKGKFLLNHVNNDNEPLQQSFQVETKTDAQKRDTKLQKARIWVNPGLVSRPTLNRTSKKSESKIQKEMSMIFKPSPHDSSHTLPEETNKLAHKNPIELNTTLHTNVSPNSNDNKSPNIQGDPCSGKDRSPNTQVDPCKIDDSVSNTQGYSSGTSSTSKKVIEKPVQSKLVLNYHVPKTYLGIQIHDPQSKNLNQTTGATKIQVQSNPVLLKTVAETSSDIRPLNIRNQINILETETILSDVKPTIPSTKRILLIPPPRKQTLAQRDDKEVITSPKKAQNTEESITTHTTHPCPVNLRHKKSLPLKSEVRCTPALVIKSEVKTEKNIHKPRKQQIKVNDYNSNDELIYISCKNCKKLFANDDQYQEHRQNFKKNLKRKVCILCKEVCENSCEIYTHYMYHTTHDKVSYCMLTPYDFMNSKSHAIDYVRMFDSGPGNFFCICEKLFYFKSKLISHIEKSFDVCKYWSRKCYKSSTFKKVNIKHEIKYKRRRLKIIDEYVEKQPTNLLPPTCRVCKLEFDNRRVYLEHIRFEHLQMYYCEHCQHEVNFPSKSLLKKHMINTHLRYTVTCHKAKLL